MLFLEIIVLFFLVFICYQDFRFRAVYWICFPVLGALLLFLKYQKAGAEDSLWHSIIGLSFFGLQLLLLWAYFSLKHKKPVDLTAAHLGWGDVLFLAILPFYLSPVNYIAFYMGSLVLVLLYVAGTRLMQQAEKPANPHIPLAGLQAIILAAVLLLSIFIPQIKLYNDAWLYGF
ncbi:hypothetical protein LPB86_03860 [Pedobacter sp. MC2016-14]|uniref:hypothetical protein n=1 Tax=Pedobacter sp. MC2016-14 TaxID=2897327 RepID=UPI001E3821AC|nr:hypothetical protein [Pedobacter sp. MC2016-14]MCD0487350.1 hypothetical protein [Pedobacter sp. MC2016-14]